MNQVYQYNARALDFNNGIMWTGVFKTADEAKLFIKEKRKEGAQETGWGARKGVSPYGTFMEYFDVDEYFNKLEDWLND